MKASNILKVVDIDQTEFPAEFLTWLGGEISPTYKDTDETFNEHIYSLNDIHEKLCAVGDITMLISKQLEEINNLLIKADTGYFRITI